MSILSKGLLEGFGTFPAPPGVGIFQAAYIPKPAFASPHSVEMVIGVERDGFDLFGQNYMYLAIKGIWLYFQRINDLFWKGEGDSDSWE